ncbi:MAG: hypothetical protein ABFD25_03255 [Clostridiaceae bacterium]
MFEWAYDMNGSKVPFIKHLYIPAATAIEQGEVVLFTPGTGVAVVAGTDLDDPSIGVAVYAHTANSGTSIPVSVSPTAVYRHRCNNIITATGGSTTTFVCAGLLPQTDDLWNGGMLEVVTCAADSSLIGKKIPITDSTGNTGTLTFDTQPAAFAAGDTAKLCPGPLALTTLVWNLDGDGTNIDWDAIATGSGITLVDVDPANMNAYFMFRLHQFGNYPKALD